MEYWVIALIIAVVFLVIGIVFAVLWDKSYEHTTLFGWLSVLGFVLMVVAIVFTIIFAVQSANRKQDNMAANQGVVIVDSASKQSYYLVTVDGACTIGADEVDGRLVVVGSDPLIPISPSIVNYLCYGGPR